MGILVSFLFPRQFMSSDNHSSSAASSSRSPSPSPSLDIPLSPITSVQTDPSPDPPDSQLPSIQLPSSPPLDRHIYSPHAVGIGILSPQPVLGPPSSLPSRTSLSPLPIRASSTAPWTDNLEPPLTPTANHFDVANHLRPSSTADELSIARPSSPVAPCVHNFILFYYLFKFSLLEICNLQIDLATRPPDRSPTSEPDRIKFHAITATFSSSCR